jgi:Na+/H+-dicarboxylate symporter
MQPRCSAIIGRRPGEKQEMSLSAKIILGGVLGTATGLFFGDRVAFLQPVGNAFIQLLQMAVLPYIIVSLIAGLGRLNYHGGVRLLVRVGALLVLIWGVTFALLLVLPLTFPDWQSASFFSTTLLEQPEPFDFLQFIPANPFHSMANTIVPGVVLFCIAVGVALIGIETKQSLLDILEVLGDALTRVMKFVMRLTPLGVFAITASAAGTMSLEELSRIQVYLLTYMAAALLMTFWVLPALVTMLTPLRYRDVIAPIREALVTAFAADNLLIVLPILADQGKALMRQGGLSGDESEAAVDVLVPASFNFPHAGKLLQLSFILFAAWFTETAMSMSSYISLMGSGLLSFFGKPVAAMPFLLDLVRIPADMFQLYLLSGLLVARFGTLVSVMQIFALALLGAFALERRLRWRWSRFLSVAILTIGLVLTFVVSARLYFTYALDNTYDNDKLIAQMQLLRDAVPTTIHQSPPARVHEDRSRPTLERIRARGVIRVGYIPDFLPFSYFNAAGDLVGFDIAMAHKLAAQLQVGLELLPVESATLGEALSSGYCDVVMSSIAVTPEGTETMTFSVSYLDMTLAFVVEDHRRDQFNRHAVLLGLEAPRIGVPANLPYYTALARDIVPHAELVPVQSIRSFFENRQEPLDALILTAEAGSAWSLLYPNYTVAIPYPKVIAVPLAYPVALGDHDLVKYLNAWVELKQKDGTFKQVYDYWILGQNAVRKPPRWSVVRDVLHWVK